MSQVYSKPTELELLNPWQEQSNETLYEAEWVSGIFHDIWNKTAKLTKLAAEDQPKPRYVEPVLKKKRAIFKNIQHKTPVSNPRHADFVRLEGFGGMRWEEMKARQPNFDKPMGYEFTIPAFSAPGFEYPFRSCLLTLRDVKTAYQLLAKYDLKSAFEDYANAGAVQLFRYRTDIKRMAAAPRSYERPEQARMALLLVAVL